MSHNSNSTINVTLSLSQSQVARLLDILKQEATCNDADDEIVYLYTKVRNQFQPSAMPPLITTRGNTACSDTACSDNARAGNTLPTPASLAPRAPLPKAAKPIPTSRTPSPNANNRDTQPRLPAVPPPSHLPSSPKPASLTPRVPLSMSPKPIPALDTPSPDTGARDAQPPVPVVSPPPHLPTPPVPVAGADSPKQSKETASKRKRLPRTCSRSTATAQAISIDGASSYDDEGDRDENDGDEGGDHDDSKDSEYAGSEDEREVEARPAKRQRGGANPDCPRAGDRPHKAPVNTSRTALRHEIECISAPFLGVLQGQAAALNTGDAGRGREQDAEPVSGAEDCDAAGSSEQADGGETQTDTVTPFTVAYQALEADSTILPTIIAKDKAALAKLTKPYIQCAALAKTQMQAMPMASYFFALTSIDTQRELAQFCKDVQQPGAYFSVNRQRVPLHELIVKRDKLKDITRLADLRKIITDMQLSLEVNVSMKKASSRREKSFTRTIGRLGITTPRTSVDRYYKGGLKYWRLMGAGTIYLAVILAFLDLSRYVNDALEEELVTFAHAMRNPPNNPLGDLMRRFIVPTILVVQKLVGSFADNLLFDPDNERPIPCSEIEVFDATSDSILQNSMILPCRNKIWFEIQAQIQSLNTSVPPTIANSAPLTTKCDIIRVPWKHKVSGHPVPHNREGRKKWTAIEREKASNAYIPSSYNDLVSSIQANDNKKHQYIRVPSSVLSGRTIKIEHESGELIALAVTHRPLQEKFQTLIFEMRTLFPYEFYPVDSTDPDYCFWTGHFTWYGRYGENGPGDNAPSDVHPDELVKEGASSANHSQRLPHQSKDIRQNPELYRRLNDMMKEIFHFIMVNMKEHLPEQYEQQEYTCSLIPNNAHNPSKPFTSYVINLCAVTDGHRDRNDNGGLCVTLSFGDFLGAELVLHESGLVFESRPGELLIFMSARETHFNLHLKGEALRGSIVVHTDVDLNKGARGWASYVK